MVRALPFISNVPPDWMFTELFRFSTDVPPARRMPAEIVAWPVKLVLAPLRSRSLLELLCCTCLTFAPSGELRVTEPVPLPELMTPPSLFTTELDAVDTRMPADSVLLL